jgi:hypothetical protein
MIVVPPGTTFEKPAEPKQPEPGAANEAKPVESSQSRKARPATQAKPAVKAEADPDARSARKRRAAPSTSSYPTAPGQRRTVLWLILLMIALGAGATAAAYYWPADL